MYDVVIVGAGPAGLTAGYMLAKAGKKVVVLEADDKYVGGISRTVEYKGYRFDIGGHRFFSKSKQVEDFWAEILPDDMIDRPRKSRIFYRKKFFAYPLEPVNAFVTLGPIEAARCMASFLQAKAKPIEQPKNFEEWVINQFGVRLYEIFFKHYTEKVWGMKCTEISADWAAQRIKGLSLGSAVWEAVKSQSNKATRRFAARVGMASQPSKKDGDNRAAVIKTLIEEFRYPRKGPGMLWEVCAEKIAHFGGEVRMGTAVSGLERVGSTWKVTAGHETIEAKQVICSAPLREVVNAVKPEAPAAVRAAANALRYRDFLTVALIVRGQDKFDDNWIYIQEPGFKVGRIQNYKSWSPEMVPDQNTSCYGLEYFCFEGDGIWDSSDAALVRLATDEMAAMGLLDPNAVIDGHVVRQKKAYPVYDDHYATNVDIVRKALEENYAGLHQIGRNGMHRYNNQDHAMMTAMLVAENILAGSAKWDPWRVNQDAEYIEAGTAGAEEKIASGGRAVPRRV